MQSWMATLHVRSLSCSPGALQDIAVSSGSACTSASLEPSYVLRALGVEEDMAHTSIRYGIGRFTTEAEVRLVYFFLAWVRDAVTVGCWCGACLNMLTSGSAHQWKHDLKSQLRLQIIHTKTRIEFGS